MRGRPPPEKQSTHREGDNNSDCNYYNKNKNKSEIGTGAAAAGQAAMESRIEKLKAKTAKAQGRGDDRHCQSRSNWTDTRC